MRRWWLNREGSPPPFKRQDFVGIPVIMPMGHRLVLQISEDLLTTEKYPLFKRGELDTWIDVGPLLNDEERSDFQDWAYTCVKVASRSCGTQCTANQLINMASTVGQLQRMCPDLVRYAYPQTKQALAAQERRSPLPYGWMDVDRKAIHRMLEHLALCYLLPEAETNSEPCFQSVTARVEWVFDHSTLAYASYEARPHQDLISKLDYYWESQDRFESK
jgi:hypothetical protein